MHNVMISKPTCKTLLLPLCALKPRKELQFMALRQFIPVRKRQPESVLHWCSDRKHYSLG